MIKNRYNIDNVKSSYMAKEKEALEKMYPGTDVTDKYILYIDSELWFPFINENIIGNVELIYKDNIKSFKTKPRRPYPNKTITMISMVNGRKACDLGIPVIFDTFEALSEVQSILIKWEIDVITSEDDKQKIYISVLYNVKFKYEEGKNIFSLHTKDTILQSYDENEERLKEYLNEFSKAILIENSNKEGFDIVYLKGDPKDNKLAEEEAFTTIMETMGMIGFLDSVEQDIKIQLFSYFSEEVLTPNDVAENIMH